MQLDQRERGFSFKKDAALDMRMDTTSSLTAEEVVNTYSEQELGKLFRELGEEPKWKRAAKAIVRSRRKKPIRSTTDLAEVVSESVGYNPRKKIHPATLVFQALRMCVNKELESIQTGIQKAMEKLAPQGKIGVLSFHSLEDRLVKNLLRSASLPINEIVGNKEKHYEPMMRLLTKKPIVPSKEEISKNPRARSAKLRFAQKL